MIQSRAGWLCVECGHIEMLTDDDKNQFSATIPTPPEVLGEPAPVPAAVSVSAPEPEPETEIQPEPTSDTPDNALPETMTEPAPEPASEPAVEAQPVEVGAAADVSIEKAPGQSEAVIEKAGEPESEPESQLAPESEAPALPTPKPRIEAHTVHKRLRSHHKNHDKESKEASKKPEPNEEAVVPVPVIDVASVVGDAQAPEPAVIEIAPSESPEKVLEESIAEIENVPETVPEPTPASSTDPTTEPEPQSEPDQQLEPQTALSSNPSVAASVDSITQAPPADAPTVAPEVTSTPGPLTPAPPEAPVPATAPAPDSAKPPLQPTTHPRPLSPKSIATIAVVGVVLLILGGAVAYASVAKPASMAWLTGVKATPAPTPSPTSTPTPVLAAEVTPTPEPAVPVNQNARRIEAIAAYKAAYLATAVNGFYSTTPPAVAVSAVEPSTGKAYVVSKNIPAALGQIQYWPGGVCSGPAKTPGTTGTKFLALQVQLEGSPTPYCVEVR